MRILLVGVVVAVAAGASAGSAMRPVLAQPAPAMEPVWGATDASTGHSPGVWTGPGPAPDYVVGTDWLPRAAEPMIALDAPPANAQVAIPADPEPYVDASYEDQPAPAAASYPSEQGDILAGVRVIRAPVEVPDSQPPV